MSVKRFVILIASLIALVALFIYFGFVFHRPILDYHSYTVSNIEVSADTIDMVCTVGGASGIGFNGYDYDIKEGYLYLTIYQQSLASSIPLNGRLQIQLDGDLTTLKGIYLVQPKGDPINIWP